MTRRRRTGRREFLVTVGLAGVSSALAPAAASLAQAPPTAPPAKADTAAAQAGEPSADARALADIVQRRYGEHLTPQQLDAVRADFDDTLKATKRLREVKLQNADEPDFTFKA